MTTRPTADAGDPSTLEVAEFVIVVLKDDTTLRGGLVGGFDRPYIELRGAQIAEYSESFPDEPRWRTLDHPVVLYRENVNYFLRRDR